MIEDLCDPQALPEKTKKVFVVQTHISIVFVADEFVYKVKKPVNFGFLDFSTLEKRHHYCLQEVKLNRRLSKDIYLDVLPITFNGKRFSLRGPLGEPVEYAVKMRRLPQGRLMKSVFQSGELTLEHLREIAAVLAAFHLNALRNPEIDQFGKPEKIRINTDENFTQVEKYLGMTIEKSIFNELRDWTNNFYSSNTDLFLERMRKGRIRDCHGDLHMEHICITKGIPIFDCIEFNDRFRYGDTISDIAFLLMDLEYHKGGYFAGALWNEYKSLTGESEVDALLTFYKVYRAFVRGKVNSFQVDDKALETNEKELAVETAVKYFQLAHSYILAGR
jgi:aminoglycoside phosphotransferase family enzyme